MDVSRTRGACGRRPRACAGGVPSAKPVPIKKKHWRLRESGGGGEVWQGAGPVPPAGSVGGGTGAEKREPAVMMSRDEPR